MISPRLRAFRWAPPTARRTRWLLRSGSIITAARTTPRTSRARQRRQLIQAVPNRIGSSEPVEDLPDVLDLEGRLTGLLSTRFVHLSTRVHSRRERWNRVYVPMSATRSNPSRSSTLSLAVFPFVTPAHTSVAPRIERPCSMRAVHAAVA